MAALAVSYISERALQLWRCSTFPKKVLLFWRQPHSRKMLNRLSDDSCDKRSHDWKLMSSFAEVREKQTTSGSGNGLVAGNSHPQEYTPLFIKLFTRRPRSQVSTHFLITLHCSRVHLYYLRRGFEPRRAPWCLRANAFQVGWPMPSRHASCGYREDFGVRLARLPLQFNASIARIRRLLLSL